MAQEQTTPELVLARHRLALPEAEEREVAPGIAVELFPGHTRHLMAVYVRDRVSGRARLLYL